MSQKVFPQRVRCKSCARNLEQKVLYGLYCSASCAGIAQPAQRAGDAPRECTTERDGTWHFKRQYRSAQEIPQPIRDDPSSKWYWCTHCGHLHIGHSRVNHNTEQFRLLSSTDDLADLLVKLRGKATRKQVAEVAGIRPIRLKELEEYRAGDRIDLAALFDVFAAYRIKPGVALRK